MRRRELVAAAGSGALSVAGCLGRVPRGPSTGGGGAPFGTAQTLDGGTLTLANPRLRKAVVADYGIWQEVGCGDGQYVVVDATTAGSVPTRFTDMDLESVAGGEPVTEPLLVVRGEPGAAPRDPSQWDRRPLAFAFPDEAVERASVRWRAGGTTANWTLGADLRERLPVEPSFELRRFEVERDGGDVRLSLRVGNTGDRPGRFLGRVSYEQIHDASSVVALDVPVGEAAAYDGVPPILAGIARDGRVVTMGYSGVDGRARAEREL